jgi:Flp pilus assembly protein TadG
MLVYFAVSLTVLLGFAGMAIDVGRIESYTIQLQAVADDAALTAAAEYQNGNSNWQTVSAAEAAAAGVASGLPSVSASFQIGAGTGAYAGYKSVAQATVTQQIPLYLIPFVSSTKTWTLTAQAAAKFPPCSFFTGADPNGYSVELAYINPLDNKYCPVQVVNVSITNSSWWNDLWVQATGAASASSISSGAMVNNPIYNQTVISDPLAYETAPVFSACTSGDTSLNITTTRTLNPGTYCGGLTIGNNANVTLNPGLYIITGTLTVGLVVTCPRKTLPFEAGVLS